MGKWGKRCSRLLPESGDAIYPKDTCAEWCIIPYYASLLFDFMLVSMGASIAFSIWINYIILKQDSNFDDSLGIYRFHADGSYVFVTNISGTIIQSSGGNTNGSYVVLESIIPENLVQSRIYCLSDFQYLEKGSEIVFDTVQLQPVSDDGIFCAIKSGYNSQDSGNYSFCTPYYGSPSSGIKILRYGFSDPTTGETKLLENECTVLKDRLPRVEAGPRFDSDLSIQVEKNINRTYHPDATQDLRILYVSHQSSVLFYVSVADIIAGGLDETYYHTFQNPSNGTNTTYLIRFFYDYYTNQFTYNVKKVYNYPPRNGQKCSCSSILVGLTTIHQFLSMGSFIYGYYDPQIGLFRLLQSCSIIPSNKLIPRYDFLLSVACSSLCG